MKLMPKMAFNAPSSNSKTSLFSLRNPATVNIDQNKEDIERVIPVVAAPGSV